MAELSNIILCTYVGGSNTFEHPDNTLQAAAGSPEWFTLQEIGANLITGDTIYEYTIDPVADANTYTVFIVDGALNAEGHITVIIQDCPPDEEHNVCAGTFVSGTLPSPPTIDGDTWVLYNGPDWFVLNSAPFNHSYFFIPQDVGTTIVLLQSVSDPSVFYRIQINVNTNCFTVYDVCQERAINIVWFLPEGGWRNYVFAGKKGFGVDIGNSNTFETQEGISKFSSIEDVHDTVDSASGWIPKAHVDYNKFIRPSIQAYVWDGGNTFTEIQIDKSSFQLYRDGDNLFRVDFKFTYGKKIIIQHQ